MNDILTKHGGTQLKDFLSGLVAPLQTNTNSLKTFETNYKKRARFNSQKIILQAALNDIFGVTVSPLIIVEANSSLGNNTYFYNQAELSPVYFSNAAEEDPKYLFNTAEVTFERDFRVKIPVGIYTAELERRVRAEVSLFKLSGKTFDVITY